MLSEELEDLDAMPIRDVVEALQNAMIAISTGGSRDDPAYGRLRQRVINDPRTAAHVPSIVRAARTPDQLWAHVTKQRHYSERRTEIWDAFKSLFDMLEGGSPSDRIVSDSLQRLDVAEVHHIWMRALGRRTDDPAGAITSARTLLESTCKHILDGIGEPYDDGSDLPKLYRKTATTLNLSPDQHEEQVFRQVLGGCTAVVEGLGSIRNRLGDAHGKGRKAAKVSPRHAALAVNLAGAMATFLVDTWAEKHAAK
jgi:hypothetical protein